MCVHVHVHVCVCVSDCMLIYMFPYRGDICREQMNIICQTLYGVDICVTGGLLKT